MNDKARQFAKLHQKGSPLILFNVWDAGSAVSVAETGAKAIATGSLGVAGALGYADGEQITLDDVLALSRRILELTDLPLTVDFEGGFAEEPAEIAASAIALAETGAAGCNFEDQIIGKGGLYEVSQQSARVAAVTASGMFVNARTDLFLHRLIAGKNANDPALLPQALERASAYADAGAGCFFAPGLSDSELIAELCTKSPLPLNVMRLPGMAPNGELAALGVARISYGPGPWRAAMAILHEQAAAALGEDS